MKNKNLKNLLHKMNELQAHTNDEIENLSEELAIKVRGGSSNSAALNISGCNSSGCNSSCGKPKEVVQEFVIA